MIKEKFEINYGWWLNPIQLGGDFAQFGIFRSNWDMLGSMDQLAQLNVFGYRDMINHQFESD